MTQNWRRRLRREIGWLFVFKCGMLIALWACFFSASHRTRVDGSATASRLALTNRPAGHCLPGIPQGDRCD